MVREKLSFWFLVFGFSIFVGCGSLDNSTSSVAGGSLTLKIQNPDESATGTAKAVDGPVNDFAVSKAAATLSVSCGDITCGSNSKNVCFASGTSTVEATIDCPSQSSFTISATFADTSKTSNSVNFGFSGSTTVDLTTGDKTATISGVFLNQATRSSGDCRYCRVAQDNNTQMSIECGFDAPLTDTQKTTARANIEYDAGNSGTSPATVDTSSDGLKSTTTNPYIIIEGGVLNPIAFQYNSSGTKQLKGACTWETDGDSNTKAVCKFGVRQWRQFDSDRNFRFAASCTKDGSTYVLVPSSGMAEGKIPAPDEDVTSLAADNASCSNNRACSSGFCAGSSLCTPAAPVGLAADVADRAGPGGASTAGEADGAATTARFDQPPDVCISPNGHSIYVTDFNNHTLRFIDLTKAASDASFVGVRAGVADSPGTTNGSFVAALLNGPESCVVNAGNTAIFVTESGNDCVRKIDLSASPVLVSTFAGTCGTAGDSEGTGTAARFTNPKGIDIDSNGTLYVADSANNIIRKITSAGVVTTLAGSTTAGSTNGTGTAASFNGPRAVVLDPTGTFLYVADVNNALIRKINVVTGVVTTFASSLTGVIGLAIEPTATNLYAVVQGTTGGTIQKIPLATGVATVIAGSSTAGLANGNGTSATFASPEGLVFDPEGNVLYIADTLNNKIRMIQ